MSQDAAPGSARVNLTTVRAALLDKVEVMIQIEPCRPAPLDRSIEDLSQPPLMPRRFQTPSA